MTTKIFTPDKLRSFLGGSFCYLLWLACLVIAPLLIGVGIWNVFGTENNRRGLAKTLVVPTAISPGAQTNPGTTITKVAMLNPESDHESSSPPTVVSPDYIIGVLHNSALADVSLPEPSEIETAQTDARYSSGSTSGAMFSSGGAPSGSRSSSSSSSSFNPSVRLTEVAQAIPEGSATGPLLALTLATMLSVHFLLLRRRRAQTCDRKAAN